MKVLAQGKDVELTTTLAHLCLFRCSLVSVSVAGADFYIASHGAGAVAFECRDVRHPAVSFVTKRRW